MRRPALDLAFLTRQTFGDEPLARELLRLLDRQCVVLGPAIAAGGPAAAEAAHTLAGAAAAVGAGELARLAALAEAGKGAAGLEAALTAVRAAIAARLAKEDGLP